MSAANVSTELLIMCGALFCFYFIIFMVYLFVDRYMCNRTRKRSSPLKKNELVKGWTTRQGCCMVSNCHDVFALWWIKQSWCIDLLDPLSTTVYVHTHICGYRIRLRFDFIQRERLSTWFNPTNLSIFYYAGNFKPARSDKTF